MKKRAIAGVLWLYAGWCLGAAIAWATGVPAILGPILALAGAGMFAGDPLHLIWGRSATQDAKAVDRKAIPVGSEG